MREIGEATRYREHAAEHDAGTCKLGCLTTAEEMREYADEVEKGQAALLAHLTERQRERFEQAAAAMADLLTRDMGGEGSYTYAYGRLLGVLVPLLDLVGMVPEGAE